MGARLKELEFDFENDANVQQALPSSSGANRLALGDDPDRATEVRPTLCLTSCRMAEFEMVF